MSKVAERTTDPWSKIAIDLTGPSQELEGMNLLTIIDCYSRYPEVYVLRNGLSHEVIEKMQEVFARWRTPIRVVFDNERYRFPIAM